MKNKCVFLLIISGLFLCGVLNSTPVFAQINNAATIKQISVATTYVVKSENIVKVSNFIVKTSQLSVYAAKAQVKKVTSRVNYSYLMKRLANVQIKINARAKSIAIARVKAIAIAAVKQINFATTYVLESENIVLEPTFVVKTSQLSVYAAKAEVQKITAYGVTYRTNYGSLINRLSNVQLKINERASILASVISKVYDIEDSSNQGESYDLPSTVIAIITDGTEISAPVVWNPGTVDVSLPGQYIFTGTVEGYDYPVNLTLTINNAVPVVPIVDYPIIGSQEATANQLAEYLLSVNPSPKIGCTPLELAQMFIDEGQIEGVRGDIAFCQSIHETGWFSYGGQVLPEQNNYGGIGATNSSGVGKGAWFATPDEGVRAQIQHLKGYASILPLNQECVDPRYSILVQYNLIGLAPNWEDLNGRWAVPGANYGQSIIQLYDNMIALNLPI